MSVSTQCLAYIGDAVFELLVRHRLLANGSRPVDELNRQARRYVSATAQAVMYYKIIDSLTEDERAVLKRGRNLHTSARQKSAGMSDYRHATGLEVLFGHLYISEQNSRLNEIFNLCVSESNEEPIHG